MYRFDDPAMQADFDEIMSGFHWVECALAIGEQGKLINEQRAVILFGGTGIAISRSGGDGAYQENILRKMSVTGGLFASGAPQVGCCVSSEITVEMSMPTADIPRMAQLVPYARVANETKHSGWIQKGLYYIDTRETSDDGMGNLILKIHGYDAMLKAEQPFPESTASWSRRDLDVVRDIASAMGVDIDSRTIALMNKNYQIPYPAMYTCRETLANIAAMYAGNFIISDAGELRLVTLNGIPPEENLLIDHLGYTLVFGQDRILI